MVVFERARPFISAVSVVVWRLRLMMHKLRPVALAGMARRMFLLASFLTLGALSANAAELITVPINKVEVIELERDAGVVLIANPTIADVAVENERLIFLFGLEPGETSLLILDTEGVEILTAPVVVVPILERRVTINRASANEEATFSCSPRCAAVPTPAGTGAEIQSTGSDAGTSDAEVEDKEAAAKEEVRDAKSARLDAENEEVRAYNRDIRAE